MPLRLRPTLALTALALGAAACSDGPAAPRDDDPRLTADIAATAGDEIAGDVSLLHWAGAEATTGGGFGPTSVAAASSALAGPPCPFSAGRFTCTPLRSGEYTFNRSYQLLDANGGVQSAYDEATTASINFQSSLSGSTPAAGRSATVTAQRNATVSGLAGAETRREWNGAGSSTVEAQVTRESVSRTYVYTSSDTVSRLVIGLPRLTNPYPLSGQIVHNVSARLVREGAQTVERAAQRRVVATFDGSAVARLQVGTRACTLDLATRAVSC
jgi:hypothetical protein